jgi:hypothetical protein
MAARAGSSTGAVVAASILGVTTFAFGGLSLWMYSEWNKAHEARVNFEGDSAKFITPGERNNSVIQALRTEAGSKSVAGHVAEQLAQLASRLGAGGATGFKALNEQVDKLVSLPRGVSENPGANAADAKAKLESAVAELGGKVAELNGQLESVRSRLAGADDASAKGRQFLGNKVKELETQLGGVRDSAGKSIEELGGERQRMRDEIARVSRGANDERVTLANQISRLEQELVELRAKNATLERKLGGGGRIAPLDEASLVDGTIISADAADTSTVYLNIGRRDRAVLGMTFEVFSSASEIRPDSEGNYEQGKATVELTRVDEASSAARVVRLRRGSTLIKGDAVANALFSPTKQYLFLVAGNFDTRGTGVATPDGQSEVRALVGQWGGRLTEDLTGDVDFVVLGARPVVPPQPSAGAPLAVQQEFSRLQQAAIRYDDLFERAKLAKVPVLNQNRLQTLTGLSIGTGAQR